MTEFEPAVRLPQAETHHVVNEKQLQDIVDDNVASMPCSAQDAPNLLKEVIFNGLEYTARPDEEMRSSFLDAARSLVAALETPREAMIRLCWAQSTIYAAIETCVDIGVFTVLAQDDNPKTATELARATNADPIMLARLLKHLAAMDVIVETGADEYRRNGLSHSLSAQRYSDAFPCMTGCITAGVLALPAHLKRANYRNPQDGRNTGFQLGFNTASHFFEYIQEHPAHAAQFNNHMSVYRKGRPSWMDVGFYPVPSLVQETTITAQDVLLVDLGGGMGHDLSEFHRKWPNLPGRLVLQDIPEVIEQAKDHSLPAVIEPMVHDFFTEQPVKSARAYYLHSVLHDWTDSDARRILSNIIPAMKRGYSKIFINENVIPSTNAYWEMTSLDIIMMADFASQERTEKQWHTLVESVGLKICKIWTVSRGVESLIECELA